MNKLPPLQSFKFVLQSNGVSIKFVSGMLELADAVFNLINLVQINLQLLN